MKVIYDPDKEHPVHVPAPFPEHMKDQLNRKFWAARRKTVEEARIESEALKSKYQPKEIEVTS